MTESALHTYVVPVENQLTGETVLVEVPASHPADAQVEALVQSFRHRGWRKIRALVPETATPVP